MSSTVIINWLKRPRVLLGLTVNSLFLIFTLMRGAHGDDRREISQHLYDPPPRPVRLPPRYGPTKAKSFYHSRFDQTSVYTEDLVLINATWQTLSLSPIFSVQGSTPVPPRTIELRFFSSGQAASFPVNCRLWVDVDGTRMVFGEVVHQSRSLDEEGRVAESLWHSLPYGKFLDIISGRHVKIRLGYTEIEMSGEQLEALRDMQRCIEFGVCR